MSRILGVVVGWAWLTLGTALWAQPAAPPAPPEPVAPGPQAAPPQPPPPTPAKLPFAPEKRWAIRGCPVDMQCSHRALTAALLEFEREAFPRTSGDSPWVDSDRGADALASARGGAAPGRVIGASKPSDIRADLAWMDKLRLPDLPVKWDQRVIAYLEFYKTDPRGRRIMTAWLERQGRYREMILHHLKEAKLPRDLLYVAMIESSYDPTEYSRVGASGLWQFMPSGARIFGMISDRWLDERNDPVKSTEAAMMYFADLHERFGNWDLAIAAYNAGYGAVLRGMAKYNTNDFWRLLDWENALPWESSVYVPKALAAAIVGNNREAFGYARVKADPELVWDNVTVPTSVSFSVIGRAAGTSVKTIEMLNPQLRRGRTPPDVANYIVRIPRGSRNAFSTRFAQLRGEWDQHQTYVVRHGQRFEDIATEFSISRSELRELNGLETEAEVHGGSTLVVPRRTAAERAAKLAEAKDNLYAGGVPRGVPGDMLIVAVPDPSFTVNGRKRLFYRVVAGNNLWTIARSFEVTVGQLEKWNGLDAGAKLHPAMVLQVWVPPAFSPATGGIAVLDDSRLKVVKAASVEHIELSERRLGRERIIHVVKAGQNLTTIGKTYGLSARDLARINNIPPDDKLQLGQKIIIYKVVDPRASDRAARQHRAARTGQPVKRRPRKR